MVRSRKEQIHLLRAYWSATTYTATLSASSDTINGESLQTVSITGIPGGDPGLIIPSRGIVTSGNYNICRLRDADTGKGIFDTDGSPIFALLEFADPDYTLTYCKYVSGSLSAVNFPSSGTTNVGLLFPEVMNIKEVPAYASLIDQAGFSSGGLGGGSFPAPSGGEDDRVAVAQDGSLAYYANFKFSDTQDTLFLGPNAVLSASGGIGLTSGYALCWTNLASNASIAGITSGTYNSADAIFIGGGQANEFDMTVFCANSGGSWIYRLGGSEVAAMNQNTFNFDSTSNSYYRFQRKGRACMSFENPSSTLTNVAFFNSGVDWQSGDRIIFINDRTAAPSGNPTNGGYLYSEGGALKWRGSSGSITPIAPA
jgi:hypothetical protein